MRASELIPGFVPETETEAKLAADPLLLAGLAWGEPRHGHPEGTVGAHVRDILEQIERDGERDARRLELRFIALVHDSLKYRVRQDVPKTGENHHATRARRLAEHYTDDEAALAVIELHDRPYALWRRLRRTGHLDQAEFSRMLERVGDLELFARFVELDSSTAGKNPEPLRWFRAELARRSQVGDLRRRAE